MTHKSMTVIGAAGLTLALSASAPVILSQPAEALDFKKLQRKVQKDFRGVGKKLRKDKVGKRLLQGAGAALVVGGIANGDMAPALVGVALIAAPEIFKQDMQRTYGNDWGWAGCVSCGNRRVLVAPGRKVSRDRRNSVTAAVEKDIKDIQRALAALDLYDKKIDGDFGKGTRAGVKMFQASLGQPETGALTGEQRYLLFARAADQGYARQAAAETTVVPASDVGQSGASGAPSIKEYRLAESQLGAFETEFLKNGGLSALKSAKLLPDGRIELAVEADAGSGETTSLTGGIEDITFAPHPISDQWVSVRFVDPDSGEETILNTVDSFSNVEEAEAWIATASSKTAILAQLTERDLPETGVAVAKSSSGEDAPEGEAGAVEVSRDEEKRATGDGPVEMAAADPADIGGGATTATDAVPEEQACYSRIFVNFKFPDGESPISHYNIVPPENSLIFDMGDSTAYVAGPCVRGKYDYSYVYVQKDDSGKNWTHQEREGSFEVAGLAEQCEIDLNKPAGSAEVTCF